MVEKKLLEIVVFAVSLLILSGALKFSQHFDTSASCRRVGSGYCASENGTEGTARRFQEVGCDAAESQCTEDRSCVAFACTDIYNLSVFYTSVGCTESCHQLAWIQNQSLITRSITDPSQPYWNNATCYVKLLPDLPMACPRENAENTTMSTTSTVLSSHAPACTGGYENRLDHVLQDSSCHATNRIIGMGLHGNFMYYACNTKIKRFALNRSASDHSPGEEVCNFPSRVNTVAVCGDGRIYSVVMSTGDFVLCDPGSKTPSTITTITSHASYRDPLRRTGMVQCDASNRVYIQDYMANKLFRYSGALPLETLSTGHDYGGMAVTTGGEVYYIGDKGKFWKRYVYDIYHVDSDGKQIEVIKAPETDPPAALAVDAKDNLFAIDYGRSIRAYNATTSSWTTLAGKGCCSTSIALGSNSNIYIGFEDGNSIRKVSCKMLSKE